MNVRVGVGQTVFPKVDDVQLSIDVYGRCAIGIEGLVYYANTQNVCGHGREQHFVNGSVVAGEVDHEGTSDAGGDAFVRE